MPDVIYLRKSRVDLEAESRDAVDVLARHEAAVRSNAQRLGRVVTDVRRELVSGDSISERPVMQQLLREVEAGLWDAVHVYEVTRLARGDTMDQGYVSRAFFYSNTKIIIPGKVYDPSVDADMEYFEFSLFMSRQEYKMINRRQQAGRIASVREGKWVANRAPYGYRREKLSHIKGWTLVPDEHADTIRSIFRWYAEGVDGRNPIGIPLIVRRLNESGVLSPSGSDWTNSVVRGLLANPAYAGWVRWGNRSIVKRSDGGIVTKSRPRANPSDLTLYPGLHESLVSQDLYDAVQQKLLHPSRPGPRQMEMKNPLAGLVSCSKCGRAMVRRPYQSGRQETLLCPYTSCSTVASDLAVVEQAVLSSLAKWLRELELGSDSARDTSGDELAALDHQLDALQKENEKLGVQLSRAYDLVEQGVYTTDVFLSRSREIADRSTALHETIAQLNSERSRIENLRAARNELIPSVRHVLKSYPSATTPKEKNALLHSVLHSIIYTKTTRERSVQGSDMTITLIPLVPGSI